MEALEHVALVSQVDSGANRFVVQLYRGAYLGGEPSYRGLELKLPPGASLDLIFHRLRTTSN